METIKIPFKYKSINAFQFPFRLIWNISIFSLSVFLLVLWVGFLLGSVLGFILMLLIFSAGFILPLGLIAFKVDLFVYTQENYFDKIKDEQEKRLINEKLQQAYHEAEQAEQDKLPWHKRTPGIISTVIILIIFYSFLGYLAN